MTPPNPKILIVVEEESAQKILKDRLVSEGCRVMQAFTWNKAVDLFASEHPDAVILDVDFGKTSSQINGVDLIQFIIKFRNYPSPFIVYGEANDRMDAGFYGAATTFVPKSSPIEELVAVLMGRLGNLGTDSTAHKDAISK